MGIAIQKDSLYLLLCEGKADCAFFRSLQKQRSSFPNVQIEGIGGKDRLYDVLVGLLLDPPKVKQLKGILIAYDTADDPVKTFEIIKNQIARTDFSVPTKLFDIKTKTGELPFICVMLIPDENTPGGLESLCNQYLESSHSWIKACISAF